MTLPPAGDSLGLLDPFPDVPVDDSPGAVRAANGRRSRRWRGLFAWSATSAPVALLLTTGIAFGPHGINLLSLGTLPLLDPVVPVALAALGVLVGLGVGDGRPGDWRAFGAAGLVVVATVLVVSAGFAVVALAAVSAIARPFGTMALASGICAATSLTLPASNPLEPRTAAARVIELGVLLPIVAGGSFWRGSARAPTRVLPSLRRKPSASLSRWPPPHGCY